MKRNFNVIQINGFRGLLIVAGIVSCLAAGFVVFPGFVMKSVWNLISSYTGVLPSIAMVQGILLWGIVVVGYLAFRKKGFFVEFKSSNDLSQAEMDEVMQRIRLQRQAEIIERAMRSAQKEFESQCRVNSEAETAEEAEKNHIDI